MTNITTAENKQDTGAKAATNTATAHNSRIDRIVEEIVSTKPGLTEQKRTHSGIEGAKDRRKELSDRNLEGRIKDIMDVQDGLVAKLEELKLPLGINDSISKRIEATEKLVAALGHFTQKDDNLSDKVFAALCKRAEEIYQNKGVQQAYLGVFNDSIIIYTKRLIDELSTPINKLYDAKMSLSTGDLAKATIDEKNTNINLVKKGAVDRTNELCDSISKTIATENPKVFAESLAILKGLSEFMNVIIEIEYTDPKEVGNLFHKYAKLSSQVEGKNSSKKEKTKKAPVKDDKNMSLNATQDWNKNAQMKWHMETKAYIKKMGWETGMLKDFEEDFNNNCLSLNSALSAWKILYDKWYKEVADDDLRKEIAAIEVPGCGNGANILKIGDNPTLDDATLLCRVSLEAVAKRRKAEIEAANMPELIKLISTEDTLLLKYKTFDAEWEELYELLSKGKAKNAVAVPPITAQPPTVMPVTPVA